MYFCSTFDDSFKLTLYSIAIIQSSITYILHCVSKRLCRKEISVLIYSTLLGIIPYYLASPIPGESVRNWTHKTPTVIFESVHINLKSISTYAARRDLNYFIALDLK